MQALVERIAARVGRALQRKGLLVRDCENSYLALDPAAGGAMDDLLGHSITYRVAMGPRSGPIRQGQSNFYRRGVISARNNKNSRVFGPEGKPGHLSADARMLRVIETVYDAAIDESRWPRALKHIATFTESQAATLWVLDGANGAELPIFVYTNFESSFIDEYLAQMAPLDPTVRYLLAHPDETIVHDGLVIDERAKNRHPYYDWHERHSDTRFRLVGQMTTTSGQQAGIALHRTRRAGRYEPFDIARFAVLHAHLVRAIAIGIELGTLRTFDAWTDGLLDSNPAAIFLLDAKLRVVHMNRSAEALLAAADGISITADGISLARKRDNDGLALLLDATLKGHGPGGILSAGRRSRRRAYTVLVTPIADRRFTLSTLKPAICMVIRDPETVQQLAEQRLKSTSGLTDSETALARLLAGGQSLKSAAESLGITYGTARTRLAQIFHKTQTRRQGELVRLLLTTYTDSG